MGGVGERYETEIPACLLVRNQLKVGDGEEIDKPGNESLRQCRIRFVVHFLFFLASFKNFGVSAKNNSLLGAVSYGAQERI